MSGSREVFIQYFNSLKAFSENRHKVMSDEPARIHFEPNECAKLPLAQFYSMAASWKRLFFSLPLAELEKRLEEANFEHILPEFGLALRLPTDAYSQNLHEVLLRLNAAQWRERLAEIELQETSLEQTYLLFQQLMAAGFGIFKIDVGRVALPQKSALVQNLRSLFMSLGNGAKPSIQVQFFPLDLAEEWNRLTQNIFAAPTVLYLGFRECPTLISCLKKLDGLNLFTDRICLDMAGVSNGDIKTIALVERSRKMGVKVELVNSDLTQFSKLEVKTLKFLSGQRKLRIWISMPQDLAWETSSNYRDLAKRVRWAGGRRFLLQGKWRLQLRQWLKATIGVTPISKWGIDFVLEIPFSLALRARALKGIEQSVLLNIRSVSFVPARHEISELRELHTELKNRATELGVNIVSGQITSHDEERQTNEHGEIAPAPL